MSIWNLPEGNLLRINPEQVKEATQLKGGFPTKAINGLIPITD
jgi:hypothetical protein